MKNLKYFETITDNKFLPKEVKFKIGDPIFIKRGKSYPKFQNQLFTIKSYDDFADFWEIYSSVFELSLYFKEKYIRKAKDFEIDANKYNL